MQHLFRKAAFLTLALSFGLVANTPCLAEYQYQQPYDSVKPSTAPPAEPPIRSQQLVNHFDALEPPEPFEDSLGHPMDSLAANTSMSPIVMAAIQDSSGISDSRVPTDINVIRGRSRIIKFAQPIARVSIADPQIADIIPLAPEEIMVNGRQRGVTSLIVWDDYGREGVFDLNVTNDTSELKRAIEALAPNENIAINVTDDSVVVSGSASNSVILDEIRQLAGAYGYRDINFVDLTETPIPQVVMEVKIVEMSRQTARDIKTGFTADAGNAFSITRLANAVFNGAQTGADFSVNSGSFPRLSGGTRQDSGLIPARPIALSQAGNNVGGITGSILGFGNSNFGIAFDMLENQGKVKTLAEPKLVTTHGREASFLAGGEFPYVSGVNLQGTPVLTFREYGVSLDFTPWVNVRTGMIELEIAPEVSSIDSSNCVDSGFGAVCGLLRRSTETTVQLNDGESLMISGILSKTEQENFAQIPFIGDIPIIGELFKNRSTSKRDTELIVVVTPRILNRPTNPVAGLPQTIPAPPVALHTR